MQSVRVIAGLGNPGARYDGTRHNVGFAAVDRLAAAHSASWQAESRFCAHTASIVIAGHPVLLLKPQTYMNASGKSLAEVCRFYKWRPENLLVVVDELQLPLGRCKLSLRGSAGGHNGLEDIIGRLGEAFPRYRIGIAPLTPGDHRSLTDTVLGKFSPEETKLLDTCWERILSDLERIVKQGPRLAINTINQRIQKHEPSNQSHLQGDRDPGHAGL